MPIYNSVRNGLLAAGLWLGLGATASQALPGQSVDQVAAWMKAHPTLQATANERLLVNRVDTPARRFSFQATVFPAGGFERSDTPAILNPNRDRSTVRLEKFTLVDMVDGVSVERLEESLRLIYGPEVYSDYRRAQPIYSYPEVSSAPLLRPRRQIVRGELREGAEHAYWIELFPNADGTVYTGTISVLLKSDLGRLQSRLQSRLEANQ
ncbi:MAG: hypothetical protein F6J97_14895 [Leptolyngbya sp. SIO4C1]|nr:hypothetical protein [Leptolyngbya sp. SIO4C1]